MAKKNKNKLRESMKAPGTEQKGARELPVVIAEEGGIGGKGAVILALALILAVAGYFLLGKTDPAGTNVYAILAPAALLAGYLLVFPALRGR